MSKFNNLWTILRGPQLYRLHKTSRNGEQGEDFQSGKLESRCQVVLNTLISLKSIICYTSPLWIPYMYCKGMLTQLNLVQMAAFTSTASVVFICSLFGRMVGRIKNPVYMEFLRKKQMYQTTPNHESFLALKEYDFDFDHFPVEFQMSDVETQKRKYASKSLLTRIRDKGLLTIPRELTAYALAHMFGIKITYPGATAPINAMLGAALFENRAKTIEKKGGIRGKLVAADGNFIDTMLIDKRNRTYDGEILVICCEGNAGFYEVGCMSTPMQLDYSVLGWNHPGFGASTGTPFPEAEKNAIDVVMQYAIHKLNFQVENIYVFAWSIGGYTAVNAANMYPDIRGLILDATFHDILPFGKRYMPGLFDSLTEYTVRNYLNLWNSKYLSTYDGDVTIIRRTKDEVMNVDGVHNVMSNMGNLLIEDLLWKRYPNLFDGDDCKVLSKRGNSELFNSLWQWLRSTNEDGRDLLAMSWSFDETFCLSEIEKCREKYPRNFKSKLGLGLDQKHKIKLMLFLLSKYVVNYDATHCTQLPVEYFQLPWKSRTSSNDDHEYSSVEEINISETEDFST